MAWRDNALGLVINGSLRVDLKKLKEEGLAFVIIEAGTGPFDKNPEFSKQVQDAYDNDLPVLIMYTPYPDQEEYTHLGNIQAHQPVAVSFIPNRLHHAYIVNVDRNWTGTDYEEYQRGTRTYDKIRWSTPQNISGVAKAILEYVKKYYGERSRETPVLTRTSDGFVQTNALPMTSWVGSHPFYLADWRYRMPNPMEENKYTRYVVYGATPTPVETLSALRVQLPPIEAKNPLVPGADTPLRFWEFSGRRFVHPAVRNTLAQPTTASWVLFNGDVLALHTFLKYTPRPVEDKTPPSAPTGVTAHVWSDQGVEVSWDMPAAAEGVVQIDVFRNGVKVHQVNEPQTVDFYEDGGLTPGVYAYSLEAVDAAGNRSPRSQVATVVIEGQDPGGGGEPIPSGAFFPRLEAAITAFAEAWLNFNK